MTNTRPSQADSVLDYLKKYGSITQAQATDDLGISRLASRISELKTKRQIPIGREMIEVKSRRGGKTTVAKYSLKPEMKTDLFE